MISTAPPPTRTTGSFSDAFERADLRMLLACYSDSCQISLVTSTAPDRPVRRLNGHEALRNHARRLFSSCSDFRVVNEIVRDSELTVIAECRRADGTLLVIACTALLAEGLITHQFVVVI